MPKPPPPGTRVQERTRGRKWQRIRARQLRHHPLCAVCMEQGLVTQATEVDHITPLDQGGTDHEDNLQSLCTPCHVVKTQHEQGNRITGCDASGLPLDPNHPWFSR